MKMTYTVPSEEEMLEYEGRVKLRQPVQGRERPAHDALRDGYTDPENCYSRADARRQFGTNGGRSFG